MKSKDGLFCNTPLDRSHLYKGVRMTYIDELLPYHVRKRVYVQVERIVQAGWVVVLRRAAIPSIYDLTISVLSRRELDGETEVDVVISCGSLRASVALDLVLEIVTPIRSSRMGDLGEKRRWVHHDVEDHHIAK